MCVGLGAVGVVVPGLPTTIFLIVASVCFTKSCPWLEDRLLRVPLFAPYMRFIDGDEPMPRRARVIASSAMWGFVGLSLGVLAWREALPVWLAGVIIGAAGIGTVAIWRYRREGPERVRAAAHAE